MAAKKIEAIGYERLRIYLLSRRCMDQAGKPFEPNIHYRDIIQLYDFDACLRSVVFEAVGRFEVIFRKIVSEKAA